MVLVPKKMGGMGTRDLYSFNLAMLVNHYMHMFLVQNTILMMTF